MLLIILVFVWYKIINFFNIELSLKISVFHLLALFLLAWFLGIFF